LIGGPENLVQQEHHLFLDEEWPVHYAGQNVLEELPLHQVRRRIGPASQPPERTLWLRPGLDLEFANSIQRHIARYRKPIAAVPIGADRVPAILLSAVVEGDYVRIGRERPLVLVLDGYRGPRKDKAVIPRGAGIFKGRVTGGTSKRANPHQGRFKDNSIGWIPHAWMLDVGLGDSVALGPPDVAAAGMTQVADAAPKRPWLKFAKL
jgi:hypothetical protein